MTAPEWAADIDAVDADFVKPNPRLDGERLGQSRLEQGPVSFRDRLKNLKSEKTNVRPPREVKEIPNKPGQFVEPVEEFYMMAAFGLMPFKPEVAMTILSPAKSVDDLEDGERVEDIPTVARTCAIAWDNAAQRSPAVRRALDKFTTVSVLGALVTAHMPIVLAAMSGSKIAEKFNPAAMKDPANA